MNCSQNEEEVKAAEAKVDQLGKIQGFPKRFI